MEADDRHLLMAIISTGIPDAARIANDEEDDDGGARPRSSNAKLSQVRRARDEARGRVLLRRAAMKSPRPLRPFISNRGRCDSTL